MTKPTDTGLVRHVRVTSFDLQMLEYIAERGGEIPWDWSKCSSLAKESIASMINRRLVIEREYVTHAAQAFGELRLRLTDTGRQVVDQAKTMKLNAAANPVGQRSPD